MEHNKGKKKKRVRVRIKKKRKKTPNWVKVAITLFVGSSVYTALVFAAGSKNNLIIEFVGISLASILLAFIINTILKDKVIALIISFALIGSSMIIITHKYKEKCKGGFKTYKGHPINPECIEYDLN